MNPFIVDISPQQASKLHIAANCTIKITFQAKYFVSKQHSVSDVHLNSDIEHLNFKIWCHSKIFDSIIL